ncbi:ABC transporter ATP-binding protein [Williamsia deligens]|uniref:ABC transporter ATP-binding protein n=1 Tax=Williamsia deligens TaxID=321325 RepID=A0ABW3G6U5_9NOCA|nr:ABC transporter ATP-binding protein [Williamsia deligens]MCP2193884.1 ABC-2 type transport system ATP-binding protein [Williamsia deligens]
MTIPFALEARALTRSFSTRGSGSVRAVDGVDLAIRQGEVVAFLGPNGAGKTTTLDMALGLTRPDSGSVRLFGMSPDEAVAAGRISAVLQSGGLLPDFTVGETVAIIAATHRGSTSVDEVMARAGITEIAGRKVSKCSGGEQQRLKFALALLPDPDLIVLDEPTAGMDVESRRAFWAAMRDDAGAGRTVLFATHYLEEADAFADRIVMIAGGRVVADGTTAQIRAQASGRTVSAVVDPASVDWIRQNAPGVTAVTVRGGRVELATDDSDATARFLFAHSDARDVEIVAHDLEDAFVALTSTASTTTTAAEENAR